MEDLEICKRIAEIEGVKTYVSRLGTLMSVCKPCNPSDRYNPLTDDATCFQLIVKYDCDIIAPYRPNNDTHWECQVFKEGLADTVSIYDDSLNKAICLAIIESVDNK